jgi:hypothetical protein
MSTLELSLEDDTIDTGVTSLLRREFMNDKRFEPFNDMFTTHVL